MVQETFLLRTQAGSSLKTVTELGQTKCEYSGTKTSSAWRWDWGKEMKEWIWETQNGWGLDKTLRSLEKDCSVWRGLAWSKGKKWLWSIWSCFLTLCKAASCSTKQLWSHLLGIFPNCSLSLWHELAWQLTLCVVDFFTCSRGEDQCGESKSIKKMHTEKTIWICMFKSFYKDNFWEMNFISASVSSAWQLYSV